MLCILRGNGKKLMVVYKCECVCCGAFYINNYKKKQLRIRMTTHFNDTRNLVYKGTTSDSFPKHVASHFRNNKMKVLYSGNTVYIMKALQKNEL